ncbi:MAG TPA: UdgX family uracil-DNA binding protein, partial [Verrucomicrobiae bacterium]|nr:UdgX family uracil-DNA binding protein [Verrucomicrobiae bacterium]
VFGEGPQDARVVFIGEQPGDKEDREGHPFIGPAGRLLDKALEEAGVDRSMVYVTNAVKHFKWEPRGKRRMHHTPNARDIAACRPWLQAELRSIQPALIVTLGATAARSVFEVPIRVTQERGAFRDSPYGKTLITIHPSALLRKLPGFDFDAEFKKFVADLKKIPRMLAKSRPKNS